MAFGDEIGLFWQTPPRVSSRGQARRELVFRAENINLKSDWVMPELDELPELDGHVAIDLECYDPDLLDIGPSWAFPDRGRIVGVCVATDEKQWYLPTQHENGNNLPHRNVMAWLGDQLAKPSLEPIFANAQYDVGWLTVREKLKIAGPIHDVQIQMTILDEHRFEYGLDAIGKDLLGVGKDDHLMQRAIEQALGIVDAKDKTIKGNLWQCPAQFVGPYGERDARLTWDVWAELRQQVMEEGLLRIYGLEQAMIPIAVGMRARGVRTDPDRAAQVRVELQTREKDLIEDVRKTTGVAIDPWDASSIARALKSEGVEVPKTRAGKDSVRKEWLDKSSSLTAKAVRQIRVLNKARTTFIDGHVLGHARNGRIHCTFHQLRGESDDGGGRGTITGRWSSSDPNLQQIPKRNKEMRRLIRTLFLADEGQEWAALDYSSQEPRLIVHFASTVANPPIAGADAARQRYVENPRTDYHQMVADFCGIERDQAKPINLGIGYGMGGAKLCRELGLPVEYCLIQGGKWNRVDPRDVPEHLQSSLIEVAGPEGKALIDKYHDGAPFIKGMIELCQKRGNKRGYITTLLGRRGRFPLINGERVGAHAALNKLAQGSAADQTKEAMRILHQNFGVMPLLTMHDELGLSVDSYEEARFAADVMELAVELRVPSIVDVKMGPNWGDVDDRDPEPSLGRGTTARHAMGLV